MKRHQVLFIAFAAFGVFVFSCAKESTENTWPHNTSSNGALNNYLALIAPPTQSFTVNVTNGGTVSGSRGSIVQISPGAFLLPDGSPATGIVTVELIEVFTKKDMIGSGAFTTSDGILINSGGEIKITAWQGAQELELAYPGAIEVQIPTGNNPVSGMHLFSADEISAGQDFVVNATSPVTIVSDTAIAIPINRYSAFPSNLRWTNIDQFVHGTDSLIPFTVCVPMIFNYLNSEVYVVLHEYNGVCGIPYFDPNMNAFDSGHYRIAVGFNATFIIISEISGQFYYAEQQLTIGTTCVLSLVPQPCTMAFVDQKLNAL